MDIDNPRCRLGLRMYQTLMEKDRRARLANQQRLRELRRDHRDVRVFCAHDPEEFEQLAGRPMSASPPVRTGAEGFA
jgi:glyoxylase-like metal-dependent hydrolase (beta-lactamase superfamily II)